MAHNASRSMNSDLQMGMTDGSTKLVAPDRGGVVEAASKIDRLQASPLMGIADDRYQAPDGSLRR